MWPNRTAITPNPIISSTPQLELASNSVQVVMNLHDNRIKLASIAIAILTFHEPRPPILQHHKTQVHL